MKTTARPTIIYFLTSSLSKKMSPANPFKSNKLFGAGVDPMWILASTRTSENIKLENKTLNLIQYYGK
jgi:hypothetical protein